MATLQEQNEAYDAGGVDMQRVKAAMANKVEAIYNMATGAPRSNLVVWADDVMQNKARFERDADVIRRYVFAYHSGEADLSSLTDPQIQTAVDAYVDDRYNPA